jgi:class 3 adenylate cyclase
VDSVRKLGIHCRAGVHTGECEVIGEKLGGIAVHIGARIGAIAAPDEVLVSRTVSDLVTGSGLRFEERGTHSLKGEGWRIADVELAILREEDAAAHTLPFPAGSWRTYSSTHRRERALMEVW